MKSVIFVSNKYKNNMNVATVILDQEGVSINFKLDVEDIKTAEKNMYDKSYEDTWKNEMSRDEFDEEIASQWGFISFEVKSTFNFDDYQLTVDGKGVWNRE